MLRFRSLLAALLLCFAPSLLASIGTWNGGWPPIAGSYNSSKDANVPVTVSVQETPAKITLTLHRAGAYTIFRKLRDGTDWGTALATLPTGSTTYEDSTVNLGTAYEYKVVMTGTTVSNGVAPTGYLVAGVRVDQTAPRGRVVLVVTDTIANGLPKELDAYKRDLGADGWMVHTITTPPAPNYTGSGNLHQPIRTQIQDLNTAYPGEIKNIILLGKVPVVRSGIIDSIRPDGHYNSYAEASDSYYAEMDGNWTDTSSNAGYGSGSAFFLNVAGDGLFDASKVSALGKGQMIDIGFGRIDLTYGQASELATTRLYLEKLARYRRAADDFQPGRRGGIRKGYDNVDEAGWMSMTSLLGPGNIVAVTTTADLPSDPTGRLDGDGLITRADKQGPFLFYFKGTGMLDARDDDSRAVFWTGMQSHWGWWADSGAGEEIERLATDNYTLSFTWSIWGVRFFYHRLGLGGDMGDVLRTSINNSSWSSGFYPYGTGGTGNGDRNGRLWISHMGDPTLRIFPVRPPTNLSATSSGSDGVSLAWTPSDDTSLLGVHVYRAPSPTGPWVQLTGTGSPYEGATYSDTPPAPGDWTYSVRAVKLETTSCGTYLNPSLGATVTVQTGTAAAPLAITTGSVAAIAWNTKGAIVLTATGGNAPYTWTLASGRLPNGMSLFADGTISGTPTHGGDTFQPVFKVTDFRGASAQIGYELGVTTRRTQPIPVAADTYVRSHMSYAGNNFGTSTVLNVTNSPNYNPYTINTAHLRFILPPVAAGERLEAARLCFTFGGGSATSGTTTISAALLADAGDAWVEGALAGSASTGTAMTYTNRPTALNTSVASATYLGSLAPNGRINMNVLPQCAATLSGDPTGIMSLLISTNTPASIAICSRENPPAVRPVLEMEITHAPLITLSRPLAGAANLPPGQGLVLNSSVTDTGTVTNNWSKISGPGDVTFADASNPSTTVTFSMPGRYSLRFTSDDGELVSQQIVNVQVLANGKASADNLVLFYRFDESSGTTAADSAPDAVAHTGTFNSTTLLTWSSTSGKIGGALNFVNANRYVQVADQDALDNTSRLSLALWVNPIMGAIDANARSLLSKRGGDNVQEAYTLYMYSGRVYARFGGNNFSIFTTDPVLTGSTWTHIAAVYDGTKAGTVDCVTIYINGVAVPLSGGIETDTSIPNTTSALWIGHMYGGNSTYTFRGLMDEVRIYRDRALSAADVGDLLLAESCQDAPRLTVTVPIENPTAGEPFALTGAMTDDGLPIAPGSVSFQWSKVGGAPGASFTAPYSQSTNATATGTGALTLRLTADDGAVATFVDASLTINASIQSYNAWAAKIAWPDGTDASASGDADRDGISNLLEYALNLNPLLADAGDNLPAVSQSGDHFALTFTRDPVLNTLSYEVQASPDLSENSWTTIARATAGGATTDVNEGTVSITETAVDGLLSVKVVDATVVSSASRRFLRLRVTQQ